ncbi:MAG TPA: metalloregulator ArsR/SmtB family transcription factor [Trebonia sp.]|nr:metalloregulator ArsR/SmtB family transcription factor [Trebonia sp.]
MSPGSPEAAGRDQPSGEDELWEAVADASRRKMLDLILARGQATPTALAAELPFTRQAVAKHLAVLARAGLVDARRQGREVHYSVRPERLDQAARAMARTARAMAEAAARWDRRLDAIKRLAEQQARVTTELPPPAGQD